MKPGAKHMELALSLIEQQTIEFEPENYKDRYYEAMQKLLVDKVPEVAAPEQAPAVLDLMEALKKSIEKAEGQKST